MTNLPTTQGDSIYASKDGVKVYKSASINSEILGSFLTTRGDVQFSKGDLIGTFTGGREGSFYEVSATIKVMVFPFPFKQNKTITGWVLGNQISTVSQNDLDEIERLKIEKEEQERLDALLGDGTDKNLTANGQTPTSSNNTFLYVLGGLSLLLGGAYLWFTRKKKPVLVSGVSEQKLVKTVKK